MAAEALRALGHPALIEGLVDVYAPRVQPLRVGEPIPEAQRAEALGDPSRLPDWVATYDRELAARPWTELLAEESERLLPGLFASACHGLLRVAHGVRAVEQEDTPARRREIALGLALWAGRYQELPGRPARAPRAGQDAEASFAHVAPVPADKRRGGFFFDAVRVLDDDPHFAALVEGFDPGDHPVGVLVHEIAIAAARRYLAQPGQRIAHVHCVTAPACLRLFAHHLPDDLARRAVGYALQASLALHAASAEAPQPSDDPEVERLAEDEAEIRYRAACSVDEHAVKMAEACLREYAVQEDPCLRRAAADAAIHLDAGAGRGARC